MACHSLGPAITRSEQEFKRQHAFLICESKGRQTRASPIVNQEYAGANRRSVGSAMARNGGSDAGDASVWPSSGAGSTVAATEARSACRARSGFVVIAYNLVNIGRALQKQTRQWLSQST